MIAKLKTLGRASRGRRDFLGKTAKGLALAVAASPLTILAETKKALQSEPKAPSAKEKNFQVVQIQSIRHF